MYHSTTDATRSIRAIPVLSPACRLGDHLVRLVRLLENWRRRQQLSAQLGCIDAHTLHDAGISEAQRFLGVNHPFD